jgi:hypothetical protein
MQLGEVSTIAAEKRPQFFPVWKPFFAINPAK